MLFQSISIPERCKLTDNSHSNCHFSVNWLIILDQNNEKSLNTTSEKTTLRFNKRNSSEANILSK